MQPVSQMSQNSKLLTVLVVAACILVGLLFFGPFRRAPEVIVVRAPEPVSNQVHPTAIATTTGTTSEVAVKKASFKSTAKPCTHDQGAFDQNKRSQLKEDENLLQYFKGLCGGTYVELGALDGVTFSNTYAFNKAMGWKGVLIELVPDGYNQLKVNRQNELLVVHAAVCATHGKVHYVDKTKAGGAVAGVWEFAAPTFRQHWWSTVDIKDATEIDCMPLSSILDRVNKDNFYADFFSLDVEGAELSVLESIDFNRVAFGLVLVEADEHSPFKNLRVQTYLASKGYVFMRHIENSDWFVNSQFSSFYE